MTEYYPGPWRVEPGTSTPSGSKSERYIAASTLDGSYAIALVYRLGAPYGDEVTEANARLMASAPDLLAALKAMRDFTREEKCGPVDVDAQADAAIAKAEGK